MWIIPVIIAAAAALGGVAYLSQRTSPSATEDSKATSPANHASSAVPAAAKTEPQPAKAIGKNDAAPAVETSAPPAPPHLAKPASAARLAPKRVGEAPPVPSAPVVSRFGSTTEPPAPAPVAAAEAMAPVREAPAPDRWQVMADQINRCGRDGFFAGVICEQRVRLKYCEGYWGQAAQCPSGIPNDHGQ
jgi:hypothetical protein